MGAPAWFKFFPLHWTSGTFLMSPTARAFYVDLLCYQWDHEWIPANHESIARIVRAHTRTVKRVWPELEPHFELRNVDSTGSQMANDRLFTLRLHAIEKAQKLGKNRKAHTSDQSIDRSNGPEKIEDRREKIENTPLPPKGEGDIPSKKSPPSKPPLPFPTDVALRALTSQCPRVKMPADFDAKHGRIVADLVRAIPALEDWELVGEWLSAGGVGYMHLIDIFALKAKLGTWVTAAREWRDIGRRFPEQRSTDYSRGRCVNDA